MLTHLGDADDGHEPARVLLDFIHDFRFSRENLNLKGFYLRQIESQLILLPLDFFNVMLPY